MAYYFVSKVSDKLMVWKIVFWLKSNNIIKAKKGSIFIEKNIIFIW